MRKGILLTGVILPLFAALPVFAQLAASNESGISLGHLHLLSKNPEAQKKIWVEAFGAQLTKTGTLELLRLPGIFIRSEEHTSELQSQSNLVCRLLLEKKKNTKSGISSKSNRLNDSTRLDT